jgi:hypothetical protein
MSVHAHNEWADSMSDWACAHAEELKQHQVHRALPLPPERQWVAPQGRIEQGWPARRCSPEMARELVQAQFHNDDCGFPFGIDRLPEAYDPEDQSDSADADVVLWLLKGLVVVLGVLFCAWVIAGGPNV